MTIILEDGTALATAETLASVAECDTFHLKRGSTAWAALSVPEKERALHQANDYLRQAYRSRWAGEKVKSTQGCEWPRAGVVVDESFVSSESVPSIIKGVVADLALRASAGSLNPDMTQRVKRERVDSLETEYAEGSSASVVLSSIEDTLRPYLRSGAGVAMLVRQ